MILQVVVENLSGDLRILTALYIEDQTLFRGRVENQGEAMVPSSATAGDVFFEINALPWNSVWGVQVLLLLSQLYKHFS